MKCSGSGRVARLRFAGVALLKPVTNDAAQELRDLEIFSLGRLFDRGLHFFIDTHEQHGVPRHSLDSVSQRWRTADASIALR